MKNFTLKSGYLGPTSTVSFSDTYFWVCEENYTFEGFLVPKQLRTTIFCAVVHNLLVDEPINRIKHIL